MNIGGISRARCDFLVMGAGVAGLRAALELAAHGDVLVVTKEAVKESNTHYAQGGIAVAENDSEDIALHLGDTVNAGDGLVHRPAAQVMVSEGPERVDELIEWGAHFDEENGRLLRTREAAHSLPRILHANGDATGAEISRSLATMARSHGSIRFAEWTCVTELVVSDGRVVGADLLDAGNNATRVCARAVLIAAGGAGQVYSDTTNPAVATGDGIALAAEAGAELADMEFYQFHPTAFSLEGAPRFLISEALRGEGAYLRNDRGERFMERYSPMLELAPRAVVARAVAREGMGERLDAVRPVYLDMRHVKGMDLQKRFPGISAFLAKYGLELQRDLIPVRPAAHYMMGGVKTDLDGRTTMPGLYAAGEAACTGVHGANRLASNSLLEGLVFGARAAKAMLADGPPSVGSPEPGAARTAMAPEDEELVSVVVQKLQRQMWSYAGLLRAEETLRLGLEGQGECEQVVERLLQEGKQSRALFEARAVSSVAKTILRSALARTESRGAHFRSDYPQRNDAEFQKHSIVGRGDEVVFEAW
ncbi:L-aspartate oxidase [Occallatibacter riparius]|uniref:L-aspartate oxidase n=1 Tax=Occallatibacter riparius TaxID=1002689 RepID=A0A9J7BVK0_9BACT|nr:L-aspartate oxidase [Occallatibacter riparius]UWZ86719.1 L-aspartate oxidase [Occallatibacter riparius]